MSILRKVCDDLPILVVTSNAHKSTGNVLMLSEGTLGVDNTYFLKEGTSHSTNHAKIAD